MKKRCLVDKRKLTPKNIENAHKEIDFIRARERIFDAHMDATDMLMDKFCTLDENKVLITAEQSIKFLETFLTILKDRAIWDDAVNEDFIKRVEWCYDCNTFMHSFSRAFESIEKQIAKYSEK